MNCSTCRLLTRGGVATHDLLRSETILLHASSGDSLQRLSGHTPRIFANPCAYKRQQLERCIFFSERTRWEKEFPSLFIFELVHLLARISEHQWHPRLSQLHRPQRRPSPRPRGALPPRKRLFSEVKCLFGVSFAINTSS